jgi:hypothetical protein
MRARAERLPTLASDVAKAGAEAIVKEWLEVMPVDTSTAISNTRIGLNSPPQGVLEAHVMGRKGSSKGASSARALDEALETLRMKQPGQDIYASNTAPYIGDLDRGTSQQFAGGFVPRALIVFRVAAQAAAKRLLK